MPILLQINSYKGSGSIGKIADQIATVMHNKGWECYIASGRRYSIASESQQEIIFDTIIDEYIHFLLSFLFDRHGRGSKVATRRLIKEIDRIKPDIIHIHNIHGYYVNYPLLFQYLANINVPIVWTIHDCWPFTGHCSHFDYYGCMNWKSGCHNCNHKAGYPKSILLGNSRNNYLSKNESFTLPRNITLVGVSAWISSYLKQSFLNKYPIKTIYNGINLEMFKPCSDVSSQINKGTGKFIVLGVASEWNENKGLEFFINLSERQDLQIIIVGLSIRQICKLPPSIIAIKKTNNQQELAQIYSSADVFVNPTLNDNFPTVNIEALACGTPVVTYCTGGCPEAIDESSGIVVEKGNAAAMEKAIDIVRIKGKSYYSANCRKRAELYYNKNERFLEYAQLYMDLFDHNNL